MTNSLRIQKKMQKKALINSGKKLQNKKKQAEYKKILLTFAGFAKTYNARKEQHMWYLQEIQTTELLNLDVQFPLLHNLTRVTKDKTSISFDSFAKTHIGSLEHTLTEDSFSQLQKVSENGLLFKNSSEIRKYIQEERDDLTPQEQTHLFSKLFNPTIDSYINTEEEAMRKSKIEVLKKQKEEEFIHNKNSKIVSKKRKSKETSTTGTYNQIRDVVCIYDKINDTYVIGESNLHPIPCKGKHTFVKITNPLIVERKSGKHDESSQIWNDWMFTNEGNYIYFANNKSKEISVYKTTKLEQNFGTPEIQKNKFELNFGLESILTSEIPNTIKEAIKYIFGMNTEEQENYKQYIITQLPNIHYEKNGPIAQSIETYYEQITGTPYATFISETNKKIQERREKEKGIVHAKTKKTSFSDSMKSMYGFTISIQTP